MSRSITSNAELLPGGHVYDPIPVPAEARRLACIMDRLRWHDSAIVVMLTVDLSLDAGMTWASEAPGKSTDPFPVTITANGGSILDRDGNLIPTTWVKAPLPDVHGPNRQVRVTVHVTGGILHTALLVRME